jgi:hypothetical protein
MAAFEPYLVRREELKGGSPQPCALLGLLSWLLQGVLLFCCLGILYFKRTMEIPRRPIKIWMLDTSKQGLGVGSIHWFNILLAYVFQSPDA